MDPSRIKLLEELLQVKTKAELNLLANKFNIKEYSKLTKQQLIAELLKKPRAIHREFNPSFWSKHSGHIYGLASIVGLLIAAFSLLPQLTNKAKAEAKLSPLSEETRDGVLAVMPFENQTNDPNLESISLMLMDWISQGLLETGETRVIKEDPNTLISHLKENPSYTPPGSEVLIRGRYYKLGAEKLSMVAEIVDAKSNLVLYSPEPFIGSIEEPMQLIDNVKQQILGY